MTLREWWETVQDVALISWYAFLLLCEWVWDKIRQVSPFKFLLAFLMLWLLFGCATVPMVWRPDTRDIWGLSIDSLAMAQTFAVFVKAHPNEAAVCYHGVVVDTTFLDPNHGEHRAKLLILHTATEAKPDSVSIYHVFGPHCDRNTIASGHSHPQPVALCDHSDDDANLLFVNPKFLASIAWCINGTASVLYQDGRRGTHRWNQ